jgi:hypothetical protein
MALGPLTYKTPAQITQVASDLTGSEGCGLTLTTATQGCVEIANSAADLPYGVVVVGADSITPGTYPAAVAAGALEIVDSTGCVIQVKAGGGAITVGLAVTVNSSGAFITAASITTGQWVWGYALTAAPIGGQFLMRFQPFTKQA